MTGASHRDLAKRTGDAVSPEARRAWLLVRDLGGLWTAAEVGRVLAPEAKERGKMAGSWLRSLAARGHVVISKDPAGMHRYGVTARCLPIDGETLEPA